MSYCLDRNWLGDWDLPDAKKIWVVLSCLKAIWFVVKGVRVLVIFGLRMWEVTIDMARKSSLTCEI